MRRDDDDDGCVNERVAGTISLASSFGTCDSALLLGGRSTLDVTRDGTMVEVDIMLAGLSVISGGIDFVSSFPMLCSSASSVISISLRRRKELDNEAIEPLVVWSKHADEREPSVRSDGCAKVKTASLGENFSRINWKWTAVRTIEKQKKR